MINLIPNKEKKLMIRDFYWRLALVAIFSLSTVVLIASIALLPSYFMSSVKKSLAEEKLEVEKAEPIDKADQETLSLLSLLDEELSMIEKSSEGKFLVSERVIRKILEKKTGEIRISQISFENNQAGENTVSIRGTATSREKLLSFRRALEADPDFQKVDLPISNFVKGSNIQFYISLIPS